MSESSQSETPIDPLRETITIAIGPNVDGLDHQVRAAHGCDAPDPANVDDPEAPESRETSS